MIDVVLNLLNSAILCNLVLATLKEAFRPPPLPWLHSCIAVIMP